MQRKIRRRNPALAAAMADGGWTNRTLAEAVGVHPTSISNLLNLRRDPRPETAGRIAEVLQSTPSALGFEEGGDR